MLKYFSIILLLMSAICIPNSSLYGGKGNDGLRGGTYKVYDNGMTLRVQGRMTNLDFSREFPKISEFWFIYGDSNYYEIAKNDLGLGKNINLKSVYALTYDSQIPVSLAYLPGVEYYHASRAFHDFDYLASSFPYLKSLSYEHCDRNARQNLPAIYENISQLKLLKNFRISVIGVLNFTDQELEALSKMHHLKTFEIHLTSFFTTAVFDQKSLQLLKDLLPNTEIRLTCPSAPDD